MIINGKYVMSSILLIFSLQPRLFYISWIPSPWNILHDEVGKTADRYSHRRWRCLAWLAAGWSFTSTSKTSDRRCVVQVQGELEDTPPQNKRLKPQEVSFFCGYVQVPYVSLLGVCTF